MQKVSETGEDSIFALLTARAILNFNVAAEHVKAT